MIARYELKNRAKTVFAGQRAALILGYLILFALSIAISIPQQLTTTPIQLISQSQRMISDPSSVDTAASAALLTAAVGSMMLGTAFTVVLSLGVSVVEVGYTKMCLDAVDGRVVQIADIFSTLKQFGRWLIVTLLMSIKAALWAMLFFIPGIIAMLNYSQTYYIMLDDPDINAMDAINKSIELMHGHKWEYFVLGLSFILWNILEAVTFGIAGLYVQPYYQLTMAEYYRELSGTRAVVGADVVAEVPEVPEVTAPVSPNTVDVSVGGVSEVSAPSPAPVEPVADEGDAPPAE